MPPRPRLPAFELDDLSSSLDSDDLTLTRELDADGDAVTVALGLMPQDPDITLEVEPEYDDFDALFQDDLTPTTVAPANASAMRFQPRAAFPAPPALAKPPRATLPASEVLYAAPRPMPLSRRPSRGNSPSIAPVMLAPLPTTPAAGRPFRVWPVTLGAALVGCAALAVASLPLLLKGVAFQEAATSAYVAAAAAPHITHKAKRAHTKKAASDSEIMSIDDLPVARAPAPGVVSIDDLPIARVPAEPAAPAVREKARPSPRPAGARRERAPAQRATMPAPVAKAVAEPREATSASNATLHLTAMPPANVVVDGRPLGLTPRTVKLEPGAHTVVFAGPDGRAVRQVTLSAGAEKTLTAGF